MWTRKLRRVVACSLTVIVMLLLPRAATAALTLSPERAVSSPRFGPMAGRQGPAVVVSDGVDFLVVWGDAAGRGLYASRVTASGTLARVPDTPVRAGASVRDISATWTGSAYVVMWSDDVAQTVMLATLDRAGNLVAPPAELGTRLRTFPDALAFNGGRGLLAYSDYGLMNVRTALLDTNGTVLRMDVPLPVPPNTPVKLTVGGSGFAAFWRVSSSVLLSTASTPPPLRKVIETYYGVRLNAAGDPVDLPVPLATTEQVTDFGVGSGDGVFALVALERVLIRPAVTQVRLRRFLVDAETMSVRALEPVVTSGWESRILWAGQQFIAYWMDYSPVFFEFRVLPFDSGEATAPQPRVLAGGSDIALSPAIAWNGSRFLATWMDGSGGSISRGGGDVVGMLVESDAASALSAPIVISIGAMSQARPRLARTDSGHLIVWFEQERDDGSGSLFAARLSFT
ncbi:MAG: hypothetical protein ABIO78_05355, partial [Thermoanaerobaculia bacterium]